MNKNDIVSAIGEVKLIHIIEDIILKKTGKELVRDDSFFFKIDDRKDILVLNSDMFNATTDAPVQMNFYQMGRKSVLMNISDLVVKGVKPEGLIVSLGLPEELKVLDFINLIEGIVDYSKVWNLNYLGGDINSSNEIIINPTVFGFKKHNKIIFRKGVRPGNIVAINNKFGLTGIGFDIILNRKRPLEEFSKYKEAIKSVLEPNDLGIEGIILADNELATASIDSSDGLSKSLQDLQMSIPNLGFEIELSESLIHPDALQYSKEFPISLEKLVFSGGEEFIHLFTIERKNFKVAQKLIASKGGKLIKVGKVIPEEKIYFLKEGKRIELKDQGYEHFI
ncbi:MAG: thiamine-monophosphate kinase [Candidatus Lokiarchaeota archaeon]|jgi:thiamine-monophosphate kinase|nr:thiamine-monophosphate kinase [Candidatus Lokiarchaeota archaeon]